MQIQLPDGYTCHEADGEGTPVTGPIYSRRGDKGDTSIVGGARVPKDSLRVRACGTADEANSQVGLARAAVDDQLLDHALSFVQHRLLNCASRLATPHEHVSKSTPGVTAADVKALEAIIYVMTARMGPLAGFILPAGCEAAARLHVARAVVRRAETEVVALGREEDLGRDLPAFFNRLSDLLFTAARYANHIASTPDATWDPSAEPPHAT